jgi:5'-nucleotidase/UDP-sugar diphosphatase
MTGEEIMSLVRYTIDQALHEDACSCVYPYASGLRFDVNATSRDPENAFNFETLMDGKWIEVDSNRTFSLMGYFVDIHVGPRAYNQFVDEKLVTESTYSPTDLFLQYAIEKGVLEEPSKEEYSTKSYIPNE